MWFGDIDVPQPILDAALAGDLVLFVGAGASRAHPSGLPDFTQLVRKIGALAGRDPSDEEVKQPDVFLGQLEDRGTDVHRLVAGEIGQTFSQPNRLHRAIVRVAAAYGMPRIVTTNYDRHLTAAAAALTVDLRTYEAPALPVGDDFDGIVYLHGSLSQPSRQLVVTDSDFGHAYLREAWAARFLERMFSTFTVVFIGYSHGDVVMQYLARSLGSDHSRYVFTDDAENAEWRRLGLAPIEYANGSGDHSALPVALERWGELASMGQVAHRARIAGLVSAEPPTIPEEVSYIEAALCHPERIRYFVEAEIDDAGRRHRWFEWIENRRAFSALFSPELAGEPTSKALMQWIVSPYISSEDSAKLALRAFWERSWPADTWNAIAWWLCIYGGEFPKWLNPWLQLTLQNAPLRSEGLLDLMLAKSEWTNNFDFALMLLEDRTRPYLEPRRHFGSPTDHPTFEVDLFGDKYWLTKAWTEVFVPVLDQHLEELLSLVAEQIARVYRSLRSSDPSRTFDPIASRRSAIEQHEQDRHRRAIDVLIDAARDCIETALAADPLLAQGYLDKWSRSPDTILRRLAVHEWRTRTDQGSDKKLAWLREKKLLWDIELKHEVFQLIRDALPTASDAAARSLLEKAQQEHPEYARQEHPDFGYYGSFGTVENAPPFTPEELHELIAQDPTEALARLRKFNTRRHELKGPTWTGALQSLQACVRRTPRTVSSWLKLRKPRTATSERH